MTNKLFQLPGCGARQQTRADQTPARQPLEETKLSKLPRLPRRNACANCGGPHHMTEQKIRQIYQEGK